ncbi:MAG: FmdB family zinc ribbon protein [Planctomycetota bacterium]
MPIYQYKCGDCGKISEFLENFAGRADRTCVHCGSRKLRKQLSTFSPRIKEGASKRCYGCSDSACPHAGR